MDFLWHIIILECNSMKNLKFKGEIVGKKLLIENFLEVIVVYILNLCQLMNFGHMMISRK